MIKIIRWTADKMMNPVFDQLVKEYPELVIESIDVDKEKEKAVLNKIVNIPTLFFYKNGILKKKHVGACPKSYIENILKDFK